MYNSDRLKLRQVHTCLKLNLELRNTALFSFHVIVVQTRIIVRYACAYFANNDPISLFKWNVAKDYEIYKVLYLK